MRPGRTIFLLLLIAMIGIQFIEVERTNPPVTDEIKAPNDVMRILRTSCYDCHSNETKWRWYSKVAPISWIIADDVEEGRKHLNFSTFESLDTSVKYKKKDEILEEVQNEEMPLNIYLWMHPTASLELPQKARIEKWVTGKSRMLN
ncbi:MAG: heme-binding domain-containing protein [Melioribacteraceae bacterium]|nr:heme-binding domain-containing protein [Melioribacteraceae bacterium]